MAFVLYDVLPTEIVWEIEKQKQKLCMKDVVDEFNTISNFIKRNSHAGENTYYEHLFLFAKNKNNMWGESLTDEEMVKDYPELFTDGFSEEKKQIIYEDIYNDYDSYEFQDREYDETIYTDYNEFRMGDWDVEESWRRTLPYNGLLPDSSIGFLPDSSDEEEDDEYAMYPYNSDEEEEEYEADCICVHCKKFRSERYEPPITRLQLRNQQKLININEKILESYTNLSYYWFEYIEEQKQYDEYEVEQKLGEHDVYITEQEYRKICDSIKIDYEEQKDSLKMSNDIYFTQSLMKDYEFDKYIDYCKEEYKENMEKIHFLKCDIDLLKL